MQKSLRETSPSKQVLTSANISDSRLSLAVFSIIIFLFKANLYNIALQDVLYRMLTLQNGITRLSRDLENSSW
jgi:hypothetical protein